mmetsp:Transcript_21258/g.32408  ORF Transcript_21258/g.32408 Transcript_21258/m.32408 type:complete len:123 (-) Transcript_21258:56-424(-)|eukprot:CAMPEP_0196810622 /NCGR_PEP_ID=MMETSP1362-20130617/12487_1 /TAXON_ID=163516 /ORGANISM="Leptocylindrus danicus, Strain CCMP1856" /LENGTH=122 /DNA_ID=CAMNT_0042185709 /DNA_START=21 /DNA_END=389 /DNA_ORIENTATION=+
MKSVISLLFAALLVSSASAFGFGTPVKTNASPAMARKGNMEMRARVCDLLGKKPNRTANVVTFSNKKNRKVQQVNLQWKRYASEELGRTVRLRLSTKGIKTVNKYGSIDAAAKKLGVDLAKF